MSEESLLRTRQNCCRLCLAPDSECISILNSYAADKEPLATKIQNCVSIKISSNDRLSLRVCHACISYLNSWQSFKNRCVASQTKQRSWLDADKRQKLLDNNISISTISTDGASQLQQHHHHHQHHQQQHQHQEHDDYQEQNSNLASSILDGISSLKKRKSLTVYPIPAVEIKDEPYDEDEYSMKQPDESDEMLDPTLFLERADEEGDEPIMDASTFDYDGERTPALDVTPSVEIKEASCRACNLKFSTRANARRHERNLHPNLFELSTSTPNSAPVTKPTPALAAALELQRAAAAAAAATAAAEAAKVAAAASGTGTLSQQKYRQEVVNAFNKCETGGFDYDNPEKYQHLLTDEKIVFLQQNDEFLKQYQNMTCRCCKKYYATYKNFMAHMRKKYASLPRNLCFNCLKLNDSKALFISHLKRRNCINLYKVLHSLMAKSPIFANAVAATAAAAPEKLRAKELLVNKMYECKLCPRQFRLKLDFRSHVYEEHADAQKKDIAPTQCNYCGVELDDPAERKRHHNNMECIVSIRCLTCDAKFDNHQRFLDHAYDKHLSGFGAELAAVQHSLPVTDGDNSILKKSIMGMGGSNSMDANRNQHHTFGQSQQPSVQKSQYFSRMPQACPICGQQYNNYNNVLRHMESKHPDQLPQTYKCVKCGIGYPRLSNLREHMVSVHGSDKARHTGFEYIVNADAIKMSDGRAPNIYTGRYDYVMKDLMSITNGGSVDDDDNENSELAAKKMRLDTTVGSSGSGSGNNTYTCLKECPICNAVFNNNIGLSNHMRSHTAAAQNAAVAGNSRAANSNSALGVHRSSSNVLNQKSAIAQRTPVQQAIFRRSLEQAADRRFRRMRCRICQRRFSSKKSYRFHMLNDHQIRNVQFIKCKLCDAEFAYEKGLKVHMFKIHNTLLKDDMIIKQFECDICSIVYRTEDQLRQHKKTVHGSEDAHAQDVDELMGGETNSAGAEQQSGLSTPVSSVAAGNNERVSLDTSAAASNPLYWYQCKYCASNFNTNKKLAIHINSHDEFDSNDYSCKDCGNVYSGRKSLWVHRYKKHPQIPDPSECVLCKKVFFDRQMLENHIPTCNRKPITATGAVADAPTGGPIYRHKTGDDDEELSHDAEDGTAAASAAISTGRLGGGEVEITAIPAAGNLKIKLPEVACTMCGQRFTDQELFTKHIQMHERELYTDNPLAAMFDTGPADPNQFYLDRVNDNGEYACDLCHKTFTQMTAFKVHRKWHFRGDSKQNPVEADATTKATAASHSLTSASAPTPTSHPHLLGLQAVGLMPNPRPLSKSQKRKRELKCEYCPSTFISNNNLRRHIYELHKDVIGNLPKPPKIETEDYLSCRRCHIKFETKLEWIEHKIADARLMKPFGPFQWGCELCGAYVSRKEKLINHIHNHMKEPVIVPIDEQEQIDLQEEEEKQASMSILRQKQRKGDGRATVAGEENGKADEELDTKDEYEEEVLEDDEEVEGEEDEDEEGEADVDADADAEAEAEMEAEVDPEGDGDGDGDEEYEEVEEEYEDVEEMGEVMLQEDDNAHDGEDVHNDEDGEMDDEEEDEDEDGEGDGDVNEDTSDSNVMQSHAMPPPKGYASYKTSHRSENTTEAEDSPPYAGEDDEDDDNDNEEVEDDDDDEEEDGDTLSSTDAPKSRFNCDLCSGCFTSQQELQKHVKMHFLNGPGSVTLTEIKPKTFNNKNSRSSSSDVVAVSSS